MSAVASQPSPESSASNEPRFVLHGVPWWTYVALRDALDDQSGLKMTYLEGTLELDEPIDPARRCQEDHAEIDRSPAMERDVDLRGFGGATFRREAKERGLEPDECYKLGKLDDDDVPDMRSR